MQQAVHHRLTPAGGGEHEGGPAAFFGSVGIGASRQKIFQRLGMAVVGGNMQRSPAVDVGGVDIGAGVQRHLNISTAPASGGFVQRSIACGAQQFDDFLKAFCCGYIQRGAAIFW